MISVEDYSELAIDVCQHMLAGFLVERIGGAISLGVVGVIVIVVKIRKRNALALKKGPHRANVRHHGTVTGRYTSPHSNIKERGRHV